MKCVHFMKVIHRDLKSSNILIVKDGTIKLCDFGVSSFLSTQEQQTMRNSVGTLFYMAPEILNNEPNYDEKVDVYSFGVFVFFVLNGGIMPNITIIQIGTGKKADIPPKFTNFAKKLINDCWNFDPKIRPSLKISAINLSKKKTIYLT